MGGFRFKVEKVFTIPGRGVVVSGKIEEGRVAVGQSVGFLGADGQWTIAVVMAIEVARRLVEEAEGGQQASLLLEGVKKNQIAIGTVLLDPPPSSVPVETPQRRQTSEPAVTVQTPPPPEISGIPDVPRGGAIQPSSGLWRAAIILLIGAFIILALLFFQGKWDPMKRRTGVYRFHATCKENGKKQDFKIDVFSQFRNLWREE